MNLNKFEGSSFPNGIWFRSRRFNSLVLEESIENGEIKERVYYNGETRKFNALEYYSKTNVAIIVAFTILIHIVFAVMIFRYLRTAEYYGLVFFFLGLEMLLTAHFISTWITQIIVFNFFPEGRSLKKFHGAEHKVLNAYKCFNRFPTYDLIKSVSHYSENCASRITPISSIVSIAKVFIILKFGNSLHFVILVFAVILAGYVLSLLLLNSKVDMIFQCIYVSKPTEREVEVAYTGYKNLKNAEDVYYEDCYG